MHYCQVAGSLLLQYAYLEGFGMNVNSVMEAMGTTMEIGGVSIRRSHSSAKPNSFMSVYWRLADSHVDQKYVVPDAYNLFAKHIGALLGAWGVLNVLVSLPLAAISRCAVV